MLSYREAFELCERAGRRYAKDERAGLVSPLSETTLGFMLEDVYGKEDKRLRHVRIAGYLEGYRSLLAT